MTKINGIVYSDDMRTIEKCDIDLSGSLVISERVERIKERAFAWTNITSVKFPSSLKYIGKEAFSYCKQLESVDFGNNKNDILSENGVFRCSAIKNIEIPGSIKTIGEECFRMSPIKSVKLNEGIEIIKYNAFGLVSGVKKINIPKSMKVIHGGNFNNLAVIFSSSYCKGIFSICMNSYELTKYTGKRGTIYIPGPIIPNEINNIQKMLEDYMKEKRDSISYIYMINNVLFPSLKFIQAAEIYDKTHDSQVLHFLKENNTEVKNYLLESENVKLITKLISSNIFSKEQLVDILHNEICNSSIPLKAIVLDKLKKQSFESSKFNI